MNPSVKKRKFTGQSKLTLWLTPKVFKKAGGYSEHFNCPIAEAVRQQLSNVNFISVGGWYVTIEETIYDIMGDCNSHWYVETGRKWNATIPVIIKKRV